MSLRIWLPLNGDLRQQGASGTTVVNNGATVNTNGKIGSCYAFNGSTGYIALSGSDLFKIFTGGTQQFSITMWVFHADTTRAILFGDYATSGGIGFNIELSTSHAVRFYWNGSPDTYPANAIVTASGWTHVALTYDGTKLQSYINGIEKGSWSGTLAAKNKASGEFRLGRDNRSDSTAFNGRMNDFRIYDHCLSAAEVHEIAQGLMLHYKLDQPANINNNLYTGSQNFTGTWVNSSAWTTSTETYQNFTVKQRSATWGGLAQNVPCAQGDIFTISFWGKVDSGGNIQSVHRSNLGNVTTGLTLLDGNFSSGTIWVNNSENGTQWKRYWGTVQITGSDVTYLQWRLENSVSGKNFYICGIKLEKGAAPSAWSLAASEAGETNIIYDSSGYNHNGVSFGQVQLLSSTPRYNCSTQFASSTDGIKIHPIVANGQAINELTVGCWFKTNTLNGTAPNIFSLGANGFCRARIAGNSSIWWYTRVASTAGGVTKSCKTLTDNIWHHIVYTFKDGWETLYIDGTNIGENDKRSIGTTLNCNDVNTNDWVLAGYSATGERFIGSESDFRIYTTALTADDVLALYHTGAKVDNKGGIHAYELNEEIGLEENAKFINNSATSVTYEAATDTYTIVSPVGTSSWGYGIRLADTPALEVPYGMTYRWTAEVWTPVALTVQTDYNNAATTAWAGNDNDATGTRLAASNAIPANTWTRIYRGASNTHASNTNHLSIRDYSSLGLVTNGQSGPVTWKVRHLQWYLVNTTFKPQIKKTGIIEAEHFTEVEQDLNKPAQFNKRIFSVNGNEFIEL